MITLLKRWYNKYFADEEAVILLLLLISAVVVFVTLGTVLAPFLTALVLAYLLQGLVGWLKRFGLPHIAAVLITFGVFLGGLITFFAVLLPQLWEQLGTLAVEIPGMVREVEAFLRALPDRYPQLFSQEEIGNWMEQGSRELSLWGQRMLTASFSRLPLVVGLLIYLVLVPILVFFMLKDQERLIEKIKRILPSKRVFLNTVWQETDRQMANYIRGKVLEILIVASVTWIVFSLFGLEYAALLAMAVGLSVLIPYIGAAVVTVPIAIIALFQFGPSTQFLWILFAYAVIQALDGNVLVPILFSEAVNLHPVSIILSILVFGGIWGFWGLFFAIPLATLVKAIVTAWPRGIEEVAVMGVSLNESGEVVIAESVTPPESESSEIQ